MGEWRTLVLDDVIRLQRGYDLPSPERRPGQIPVVGAGGISGRHDKPIATGPGVTIGRAGSSMGKATYISGDFWPLNTALFVTDFRENDPRFIYYLLTQLDFSGFNSGAAQPMLNRNYIKHIRVYIPGRAEQEAIVNLLGAIDDKITVNSDTETTCEDLMRSELISEIKSSDACEVLHLADVADFHNNHRAPLSSMQRRSFSGIYPYYGATGELDRVAEYRFDGDYILVGEDGSVITDSNSPVVQHRQGRFWVSNHAHVLSGTKISNNMLRVALKNSDVRPLITGAVQPKLSMGNLKKLLLVLPSHSRLAKFDARLSMLTNLANRKAAESAVLGKLRDTLLPRLMSGELRVKDSERLVEDGV